MSRDLELHYRESGLPEGPTLVFLHGLFASLQNWQSIVKLLNDHYRIINIDLPNHGSSPHTAKFSFEESVESVLGLLDRLQLDKVNMIGHSLGGKIAMLLALYNPDKIQRLVVEDIAPKTYPPWFSNAMRAMQDINLSNIQSRKEADELLSKNIDDKDLRAFLLTNLQRHEQSFRWRVNIDALIAGGPTISGFPENEQKYLGPTLFIDGGASAYIQKDDHPLIQKYFPSVTIDTFEGLDHWVHARDPEKFALAIKNFIDL